MTPEETTQSVDHAPADSDREWNDATMTELVEHIESTHHVYLREALPGIQALIEACLRDSANSDTMVGEVGSIFRGLRAELEQHMMKEEQILFPHVREMDAGRAEEGFHCGTVDAPIQVMRMEHQNAKRALGQLSSFTEGFTTHEGTTESYTALVEALSRFNANTHEHIHKEEDILFTRVLAAEAT